MIIKCDDPDCKLGVNDNLPVHNVVLYKQPNMVNNYPFWKSDELPGGGRIAMWGDGGTGTSLDWEIGTIDVCNEAAKKCDNGGHDGETRWFSNEYDACPQLIKSWETIDGLTSNFDQATTDSDVKKEFGVVGVQIESSECY